jgi:hypothetical protein
MNRDRLQLATHTNLAASGLHIIRSISHDDSRHISKISKLVVWHRIIQRPPIDMLSLPLNKVNLVLGDQTHGVSGYASRSIAQKQEVNDIMYGDDMLEIP